MRRVHRLSALAFLALALALPGLAREDPASRPHPGRHRFRECLSILDLTDQQKTDILGVLEAARPALEADLAAVKAARETLRADLDAPTPEACTIGADTLAVKAAVETLGRSARACGPRSKRRSRRSRRPGSRDAWTLPAPATPAPKSRPSRPGARGTPPRP